MMQTCRPVRAKAFKYLTIYKAFALSGRFVDCYYTQGDCPGLGASALSGRVGKNVSANYLVRRSSLFILHHFLLKPKLEHAVGDEDAVLLQGNQFLVDEGFLDAVDVGFAAQWIGFCYCLGGEA